MSANLLKRPLVQFTESERKQMKTKAQKQFDRDVKVTYAIGVFCASALCFMLGWIARGAV